MPEVAKEQEKEQGKNHGNRAITRLAPLALGYLAAGKEADLVKAADTLTALTQPQTDVRDAAALFCLGVRNVYLTGNPDIKSQIKFLPADRQDVWKQRLDAAEKATPESYKDKNKGAIECLQAAVAVMAGATSLKDALDRAVRAGGECDRVATVAGALAGTKFGGEEALAWREKLFGWPDSSPENMMNEVSKIIMTKYA